MATDRKEAESTVRPEIANSRQIRKAVKKADIVYIGYLIWWGEAPHILYTLVENTSLKGKTVIPFCTSASSGIGKSASHLKAKAIISGKTTWNKETAYIVDADIQLCKRGSTVSYSYTFANFVRNTRCRYLLF